MTDNFEEHNDEFLEHEQENGAPEGAPKKTGVAGNLAEAWRTKPMFKLVVLLVGVFVVGLALVSFFGGNDADKDLVHIARAPNFKEAPGGKISPYVKEQTEMANKERSDQAIQSGGSAIPTPIGQTSDISMDNGDKKADPLNELRSETETLKKQLQQQQVQQQAQQQQVQQQLQQRPPEQFDNSLAEAMQRQMQQLLESWTPRTIKIATVTSAEDVKAEHKAAAQDASANNAVASPPPKAIVNAGTVSYAQLLVEAIFDVPGPIMVQIVSGPLTGARAIGTFQIAEGYEKYLVLHFNLADKKGKDYTINAYALDPDTTLGGMATEVDERYFARVILPAAAGFLQGMGQALSVGNSSIATDGNLTIVSQASNGYKQGIYNGMGTAAQTMSQFFQDQANLTKPLVRVAAGTPMGLFFVAPVYDPDNAPAPTAIGSTTQAANGVAPNGMGNNGYNGYNPYNPNGYPGTTMNGYGNLPSSNNNVPYPNYGNSANMNGSSYHPYVPNVGGGGYSNYNSFGYSH